MTRSPSFRRSSRGWLAALLLVPAGALAAPEPSRPGDAPGKAAERAPDNDFRRYLDAAVQLYENLEYERALEQLQRARRVAQGVEQDVALGLHEGILQAELGRWDEGRAAFETALLLAPDARLPLRVSPKMESEFEAVRADVQRKLESRRQRQALASPPPVAAPTDRPEQPPVPQPRLTPAEPSAVLTPTVAQARPSRVPVLPLALLGAGVVAGGVGSYFGLSARGQLEEARTAPFRDDAMGQFEQAQRSASVANVLFGTAGLAAAGAVVTWLLRPEGAAPAAASGETR